MRFPVDAVVRPARIWLIVVLAAAGFAVAAPAAQASIGVETLVAGNCSTAFKECGSETQTFHLGPFEFNYSVPKEPTLAEAKEQAYTQAAGHPAWGITDFKIATTGKLPNEAPSGVVTHVRTDVGPGVSANPQAVPLCTMEQFGGKEALPGTGFYEEPKCSKVGPESTVIGVNKVTVYAGPEGVGPGVSDLPLEGVVYNVVPPEGKASDFGVALELPKTLTKGVLEKAFAEHPLPEEEFPGNKAEKEAEKAATEKALEEKQYYAHTMIEGNVEWAGDYHDYYEINVSPAIPLISSRLILKGDIGTTGQGGYVTLPSNCVGPGPATTNTVTVASLEGPTASKQYTTPLGTEGCNGAAPFAPVPFAPAFSLKPATTQSDQPDGVTTELTVPHDPSPSGIDSSQLRNASITLPEGMTLNPSAARELEACTPAQIGIGTRNPVKCPAGSKIGTVTLVVPDLPASEPLQGNLYLGGPESGPITGPPYTMYIDAESARYGISVRLKGSVVPNEATGRLTASFTENPQQPFSNLILSFKGGALAPLANPLACGTATTETSLEPYIGSFATQSPFSSFAVDSNGSGGACSAPLPFSLTQGTANQSSVAGAHTSYTFSLSRADGQQYLSQVKTVLPAGLVGPIPSVTLCGEAQANAGTCTAASQIGNAVVSAGAGAAPFQFTGGTVYLTGPYKGAPYGLSIVVPAIAGPFNLGSVVTRAAINVEPYTGRVVVTSTLPTIVKGVPLRIRSVTVAVNRQNFLMNPTNCGALATDSTLTGFVPGSSATATQSLSSPFQVGECNKLAFKPSLTAFTGAKTSKANGASIEVKISQGAGQANLQKVITTLPKQLPVRQSTLTKACPQATFEVGNYPPGACADTARVGGATATTPILPGKMEGPAYLVSHGGEAFPDLDLILRGDGVVVILVGHTHVSSKGIITTTFESLPDVPVTSFAVKLPTRSNSLLAANGNLCTSNLTMPTTIMAQSGTKITQKTKISVTNCPVQIVGHKTSGTTAKMTVQAPAAGRISGSGTDLQYVTRHLSKAGRTTLNVPLTRTGREVLSKFRTLRIKVRVGFVPKKGNKTSKAYATVTFRA